MTGKLRSRIEQARGDEGFALVFVLLVITLVTIAVTSQLVITTSAIRPAKTSQDTSQALAAAGAGVQAYVAFLTANCTTPGSACASVTTSPDSTPVKVAGTDGAGTSTYTRTVLNTNSYLTDGFVRVQSTGSSGGSSRTLVADIAGLPNLQTFGYYTTYETLSGGYLDRVYPARSITLPNSAVTAVTSYPGATKVSWNGRAATNTGLDQCDRLYYDDSGVTGRYNNRSATLSAGYDYAEAGSVNGATSVTRSGICEENFTTGMKLVGPAYSRDALYLSYGTNPAASPTGPEFDVPSQDVRGVQTGWSTTSSPAAPTGLFRPFPYVGGGLSPAGSVQKISSARYDLELPQSVTGAKAATPAVKCVYSGPTRILVSGSTATVTSPYTQSVSGSACYASSAGIVGSNGLGANGVLNAKVNLSTTLIYVQNIGNQSSWRTASTSVPVFASTTPAIAATSGVDSASVTAPDTCSATVLYSSTGTTSCGWTNVASATDGNASGAAGWTTYTSGSDCTKAAGATDRLTFECELNNGSVGTPHDYYGLFRNRVQIDLARNTCTGLTPTATATCVGNFVTNELVPANTNTTRYVVTSSTAGTARTGATKSLGSAPAAPETGDAFFANTAGTPATETQTVTPITVSVGRQVYKCYGIVVASLCVNPTSPATVLGYQWGDGTTANASTPQFTLTATSSNWAANGGSGATSSWPVAGDITQYSTGNAEGTSAPGDAYIEGTGETGKLSVVAEHDVIATGKLTATTSTATDAKSAEPAYASGGAIDLVGADDVRIYHPVSCRDTSSTTTTAGFCPNDTTGLYTGGISSSAFATAHPSRQYCDMTSGVTECGNAGTGSGAVTEIDADVFALGVPGADGLKDANNALTYREGSLLTDNFDRGTNVGNVTVVGGLYQLHRGTTGVQWEITTTDPTANRPASGYALQGSFVDLSQAGLPWVPPAQSGSSRRAWNVISMSTASNS